MGADVPKQFHELDGMPLIIFTLRRLAACAAITEFLIATRVDDVVSLEDRVARAALGKPARVVHGGDTRHQSVANALAQVDPATEIVVVHDAVRPLVTREQLDRVIREARARGHVFGVCVPILCETETGIEQTADADGNRSVVFAPIAPARQQQHQ